MFFEPYRSNSLMILLSFALRRSSQPGEMLKKVKSLKYWLLKKLALDCQLHWKFLERRCFNCWSLRYSTFGQTQARRKRKNGICWEKTQNGNLIFLSSVTCHLFRIQNLFSTLFDLFAKSCGAIAYCLIHLYLISNKLTNLNRRVNLF